MKVKGKIDKIFILSFNGGHCDGADLSTLKEGGVGDLQKEQAEKLLSMGMVEAVSDGAAKKNKESKGDK